jgi:hypothetical protein
VGSIGSSKRGAGGGPVGGGPAVGSPEPGGAQPDSVAGHPPPGADRPPGGDETPGEDYACGLGENDALVPPQFIDPVWMTPDHGPEVFYGKVSPAADSVKIEIPDRQTLPARIYETPADWAAAYNLFVGFAPPGTDVVTLVVRDAQGNELERRTIEATRTQ